MKCKKEMKYTVDFIKEKIATDEAWLIRGMLAIYNRQTELEKTYQTTDRQNGVGFNKVDAEIMSSIAQFYLKKGFLSNKQLNIVKRRMSKYAKQLTKIANGQIA